MSYQAAKESYAAEIADIKAAGQEDRMAITRSKRHHPRGRCERGQLCANNYLGLANNAEVMQAARDSLSEWFGAASFGSSAALRESQNPRSRVSHFWLWKTPYCTPPE